MLLYPLKDAEDAQTNLAQLFCDGMLDDTRTEEDHYKIKEGGESKPVVDDIRSRDIASAVTDTSKAAIAFISSQTIPLLAKVGQCGSRACRVLPREVLLIKRHRTAAIRQRH